MSAAVRSVYVHAPFCARRCAYCDFAVHVDRTPRAAPWLDAISGEWRAVRSEGLFEVRELETLYVGGGTPSLLEADAMERLSDVLDAPRAEGMEWTVEANPESLTPQRAMAWRRAGVTRVSLGVQSFQESVLRWMGRLHGKEGAIRAVETARAAGFEDLSLDLIFALPAHLGRDWRRDLDELLGLDPTHVSLYGLGVEPTTPLGRAVQDGREPRVDEDRYAAEYLEAVDRLSTAGFEHYEVSNFARPGRRSRHNSVYWSGAPYLGLGNGAHSYLHPIRRWNLRDWGEYREAVGGPRSAIADQERLDEAATRLERIWLQLRTSEGLERAELPAAALRLVAGWCQQGWASEEAGRVRLTPQGWLLLDRLAVELDGVHADPAVVPSE